MEITKSRLIRIFSNIPTLKTERLTMRKLFASDYRDMYEYASLPEVTEYLLWYPHTSPDQTYRYLDTLKLSYKRGEFFDWAVTLTETGKMIGTCGFTSFDTDNKRAEVGYVINPEFWGMGIASEAVSAAIEFAFTELSMNRVEAHFIEGNTRSLAVTEKCGMAFEGYLKQYMYIKGEYKNIGFSSITADSFKPRGCYSKQNPVGMLKRLIK